MCPMSEKSKEQSYESIMTYLLLATQEEMKPSEKSKNTTGGQESKIGSQNMSKDVQYANSQRSSPTRNKHPSATSPLKKTCPHSK